MKSLKRIFKRNTHNLLFKALAGFGRSVNRFYENRNHDIHSNGESFVLEKLNKLNPLVIFDVGANVGDWSLVASDVCTGAKIFSFEPVPSTYQKMIESLQRLPSKNVVLIKKGLYKETTKAQINKYSSDQHSSLYDVKATGYLSADVIEIDLIKGDEFIEQHKLDFIDFVKLDVEGAEMDALLGLEKAIAQNKIRMIQFEYGYINITTKMLLIDFYEFFSKHGYVVGKLYPKEVELREYSFKHEDFIGPNFIAVRKSDHELIALLS